MSDYEATKRRVLDIFESLHEKVRRGTANPEHEKYLHEAATYFRALRKGSRQPE